MSISFPKTEEEVLQKWRDVDAFQTQLRLTEQGPRFTFYDGPPFGTCHDPGSLLAERLLLLVNMLIRLLCCSYW
jgi:isoleucyl-tRNA synthetase